MNNSLRIPLIGLLLAHGQSARAQEPADDWVELRMDVEWAKAERLVAESAGQEDVEQALLRLVRWRLDVAEIPARAAIHDGAVRVTLSPKDTPRERRVTSALLASLGRCEFFLIARDEDVEDGLAAARHRFVVWTADNPGRPWLDYNADSERRDRRLAWFPARFEDKDFDPLPVLLPTTAAESFGSGDFERLYATKDAAGFPAVGFEILFDRIDDFAAFTEAATGRRLAIALGGVVRCAPTLQGKLTGGGIIEGRFKEEEVEQILSVLESRDGLLHPVPRSKSGR